MGTNDPWYCQVCVQKLNRRWLHSVGKVRVPTAAELQHEGVQVDSFVLSWRIGADNAPYAYLAKVITAPSDESVRLAWCNPVNGIEFPLISPNVKSMDHVYHDVGNVQWQEDREFYAMLQPVTPQLHSLQRRTKGRSGDRSSCWVITKSKMMKACEKF